MFKVILFILMVLFSVSSSNSVSEGNKDGVCYKDVSLIQYRRITYRVSYKNFWGTTKFYVKSKTQAKSISVPKQVCCAGFVNTTNNDKCVPECLPACLNGFCTKPNTCQCNYGWGSDTCNETSFCIVAVETIEASRSLGSEITENMSENPLIEKQREYACGLGCQKEVINTNVNFTRRSNTTYYFFPIDSQCNNENYLEPPKSSHKNPLKRYGYAIGGAVMIMIVVTVIIYVVRRKKKKLGQIQDAPSQRSWPDHMEENTIYSGTDIVT